MEHKLQFKKTGRTSRAVIFVLLVSVLLFAWGGLEWRILEECWGEINFVPVGWLLPLSFSWFRHHFLFDLKYKKQARPTPVKGSAQPVGGHFGPRLLEQYHWKEFINWWSSYLYELWFSNVFTFLFFCFSRVWSITSTRRQMTIWSGMLCQQHIKIL